MTRVIGVDPGTLSIDLCGLLDGQIYLDRSCPTAEALADPSAFVHLLTGGGLPDLIVGPSGYGLPVRWAREATEDDLRLAFLAPAGELGGIGGLRALARRLVEADLPVVYVPGVIHLDTVPAHRKLNRVDLGTADKICATVLGIREQCDRRGHGPPESSFILLELGGAFTAGVAVEKGRIVDGVGGSSGPIGWRASGALDGEVAFLAGSISKASLFQGGVASLLEGTPELAAIGHAAYVEGAVKTVRQLRCSAPAAEEILLSGRHATNRGIRDRIAADLSDIGPLRLLSGSAAYAKQGAEGAALLADGLAGGANRDMVDRLRIREARGTALDHLIFISPDEARQRLGIGGQD
jgi:predicted butyrate kinase (DUF1464 family)